MTKQLDKSNQSQIEELMTVQYTKNSQSNQQSSSLKQQQSTMQEIKKMCDVYEESDDFVQ